ncbi:MAG: hypothetical protein ACRDS9_24150, partial [Pseudonocardiaceae bacterium]
MENAEVRRERAVLPHESRSLVSVVLLLVALLGLVGVGGLLFDILHGPGVSVSVRVPADMLRTALAQLPAPAGAT